MKVSDFKISCSDIHAVVGIKDEYVVTPEDYQEFFRVVKLGFTHPLNQRLRGVVHDIIDRSVFPIQRSVNDTAKQILATLFAREVHGKSTISSAAAVNPLQRGTFSESDGISLLSQLDGIEYTKNDELFENKFIKGVPDVFYGEGKKKVVIDVKCPLDMASFLLKANHFKDHQYEWQMQGYLWITGSMYGEIAYCLVNTPQHIIDLQKSKIINNARLSGRLNDNTYRAAENLQQSLTYDDIPIDKRVIRYKVHFSKDKVERIKKSVLMAREWLKTIQSFA
jgi:hypothetical protein